MDNDSPAELAAGGLHHRVQKLLQQSPRRRTVRGKALLICSRCQLVSSGARLDMVCDPRPRCLGAFKPGFDHGIAAPLDDGKVAPVLDDPEAVRSGTAAGAAAHI